MRFGISDNFLAIPLSLTTAYVLNAVPGVEFQSGFRIFEGGNCGNNFCPSQDAFGVLSPTSVTVSVSAVPIPAALPLFATGLVGLGLLGWRRKKKAAP